MTEEEMIREVRRARRANYIVFGIFAALFAAAAIGWAAYKYQHAFTPEKWIENPDQRVKIVDSLLSKYELAGMREQEVIDLLGGPGGKDACYQSEDCLVYYLGAERGFISIDSEWLVIAVQDGVVCDYEIRTD